MLTTYLAGLEALHCVAPYRVLALFQAPDAIDSGHAKLITAFIIIAALALLAQAVVVVAVGIGSLVAVKQIQNHIGELREKAMPFIAQTQELVNELTPKIREITEKVNAITAHVEEISAMARDKANEFSPTISAANQTVAEANKTVQEANLKTRAQISRVNGMISSSLDAATRLGVAIEQGISKPGREVAGVISGLRAGLDTLLSGARAFGTGGPIGRRPPVYPAATPYRTPGSHAPTAPVSKPVSKVDPDF
jgi:hypothetical protein